MNKITTFFKSREPYYALVCYFLGFIMLRYGLKKMNLSQCILVPFSAWQQPIEKLQGPQLTWAFLGYAGWFQFLIGLFEFAPAVLLFFRRTRLLGAVLMLPMTLGVFLINHALDLWEMTKWLSFGLLLANIFIFVFEWERIRSIAAILIGRARTASAKLYNLTTAVVLLSIIGSAQYSLYRNWHKQSQISGDWRHHHPFEWQLVSEKVNDSLLSLQPFSSYFMPTGAYSENNASTPSARGYILCDVDELNHQLKFKRLLLESNVGNLYHFDGDYDYAIKNDSILEIKKMEKGLAGLDSNLKLNSPVGTLHTWTFRRRVINEGRF